MGETTQNRGRTVGERRDLVFRDITPQIKAIVGALRAKIDDPHVLGDADLLAIEIHSALYDAGYDVVRRIREPICECGHPPRHHDKQGGRCYGRGCQCDSYTKKR